MISKQKTATVAATVTLAALLVYAFGVPLFTGGDVPLVDYAVGGRAPGAEFPMGTDSEGHDLFLRTAQGLRLSLSIAMSVAVLATLMGVVIGIIAGFVGGIVDQVLMRMSDTINALPHLVLGLVIVGMFRGSITAIVVSLVISHWVTIARMVRAQTLFLRGSELVASGWVSGMSRWVIMLRLVAPTVLGQAVVSVVLTIPHIVWHESTFSFLGIGLPPHQPSLGTLIADAQGGLLLGQWWMLVFPGGALVIATLCTGVIGRALTERVSRWEAK